MSKHLCLDNPLTWSWPTHSSEYNLWVISIFARSSTDSVGPNSLNSIDGYLCPDCPSLWTPTSCCGHMFPLPHPHPAHTQALQKPPNGKASCTNRSGAHKSSRNKAEYEMSLKVLPEVDRSVLSPNSFISCLVPFHNLLLPSAFIK